MNRKEIIVRMKLLFSCLQYSSQKTTLLKIGHRICINQEIASLLYKLDYPKSEINAISPELEQRVKEIERLIYKYDFQSINEFPFLIEEYENN